MSTKSILCAVAVAAMGPQVPVQAVPTITKQPNPATSASLGATASTSVLASTRQPPLVFQWRLNGTDIPGAIHASITVTNLGVPDGGIYTVRVSDADGDVDSNGWTLEVDTTFRKLSSFPIVSTGTGANGASWGDFNNDGLPDLFVDVAGSPNLLYTNLGNGGFKKVTSGPVVTGSFGSLASAAADIDNDGFLDLFVSVNNGGDKLYLGRGDGTFASVASGAPTGDSGHGNGCAWADYDRDGFVDLYVVNSDQNNFLYHNEGNGKFRRVTTNGVTTTTGNSQGCAWGDYDNDGYPDLMVARFGGNNLLFHNNGNGTFSGVTNGPVSRTSTGSGCLWADFDNDGYLDLFVCGTANILYWNRAGVFVKSDVPLYPNDGGNSIDASCADYDNDGYLDLFVTRNGTNVLLHNKGDGTFERIPTGSMVNEPAIWVGSAWGDFNSDGFPDLYVASINKNPTYIYQNTGNTNHWLTLKCRGTVSNRSAIGTKVHVVANLSGKPVQQLREISGGGGLDSQNALDPHFGLRDATRVDQVRIEWPSGIVQTLTDVAVDQILTVREPSLISVAKSVSAEKLSLTLRGAKGVAYKIEQSVDMSNWSPLETPANPDGTFTVEVPSDVEAMAYRASE